jgi:hypothetical protein
MKRSLEVSVCPSLSSDLVRLIVEIIERDDFFTFLSDAIAYYSICRKQWRRWTEEMMGICSASLMKRSDFTFRRTHNFECLSRISFIDSYLVSVRLLNFVEMQLKWASRSDNTTLIGRDDGALVIKRGLCEVADSVMTNFWRNGFALPEEGKTHHLACVVELDTLLLNNFSGAIVVSVLCNVDSYLKQFMRAKLVLYRQRTLTDEPKLVTSPYDGHIDGRSLIYIVPVGSHSRLELNDGKWFATFCPPAK